MEKKKLAKDFGIFNDMSEATPPAPEAEKAPDVPVSDGLKDIFGISSEDPKKEEAPAPEKKKETPPAEEDVPPAEEKGEEEIPEPDKKSPDSKKEEIPPADNPSDTTDEENEIEKLIREAGQGLEEIKQEPSVSPEVMKKLQSATELNDELAAKVESLTRQLEVAREQTNKNLETGEEMRIYQPMIAKLEKDPQLMILAKHYGTKNEVMKNRLTDIVKDMLHTLTGIDIYELMDSETKNKATAFGEEGTETPPPAIEMPKDKPEAPGYKRPKDRTFSI